MGVVFTMVGNRVVWGWCLPWAGRMVFPQCTDSPRCRTRTTRTLWERPAGWLWACAWTSGCRSAWAGCWPRAGRWRCAGGRWRRPACPWSARAPRRWWPTRTPPTSSEITTTTTHVTIAKPTHSRHIVIAELTPVMTHCYSGTDTSHDTLL